MRQHQPVRGFVTASIAAIIGLSATTARADVQDFTDSQRPLWFNAVGDLGGYETIDFTGFANSTFLTDQYHDEFGVLFADGLDIVRFNPGIYPLDDWGLDGFATTTIEFNTPQNWFASDGPGAMQFQLYRHDELVYTSRVSFFGFIGVISDIGFDKIVLDDPEDSNVNMDNIYFGAVPAPSTMMIITGYLIVNPKKRRRC